MVVACCVASPLDTLHSKPSISVPHTERLALPLLFFTRRVLRGLLVIPTPNPRQGRPTLGLWFFGEEEKQAVYKLMQTYVWSFTFDDCKVSGPIMEATSATHAPHTILLWHVGVNPLSQLCAGHVVYTVVSSLLVFVLPLSLLCCICLLVGESKL